MKVVVFVKASQSSEAGVMPSQQLLADMGQYNEQLVKAGIMKDGAGLHPSSKAVRVRFSGKDRTVINGPFAETKELVAGYWLWEVNSMDEAIDWLKKSPNPMPEETEIEIRPMFEAEDFGEEFTPELREKEADLEAALSMEKANVQSYSVLRRPLRRGPGVLQDGAPCEGRHGHAVRPKPGADATRNAHAGV